MNWDPIVQPPSDGELVNQSVTGRSIATLQRRTDFLYQRLNDFSAQNGKLVIQNVVLDNAVQVGDWVYFDSSSQSYKQAIAEGVYNTTLKQYTATPRTYVVGVCVSASSNLGSILMSGYIQSLSVLGFNTSYMLEGGQTYTPGRYYLSSKTPGKMTSVANAPIVQLGFLSGDSAFVSPLQKDIFESHIHYNFPLHAKPASSQNTDGSGGVTISGNRYVDYFYSPASNTPPNILVAIKGNGTTPSVGYGAEFRVEIYRDSGGLMGVDVWGGSSLDQSKPDHTGGSGSGASITSVTGNAWPTYGSWYAVPNTGLSVAFFRQDATYSTNTLASDITDSVQGIAINTDRFKFFLPSDLTGWANLNPFDNQVVSGPVFRYVREGDVPLNSVWPPTPTSSVEISNNGVSLSAGQDFYCLPQDLLWIPAAIDTVNLRLYAPWPYDYNARSAEDPNSPYFKALEVFFSSANISTAKPLVVSLQSNSNAISVTDCLTGNPATSGNLALGLTLDLNTLAGPDSNSCIAGTDPTSQKFLTSALVSRLTAGAGIKIVGSTTNINGQQTGALTLSTDGVQTSGEVSIVSLKNAKESLYNGITPCVLFLPPSTTKCQIVSKVNIPVNGIVGNISLTIASSIFGSTSVGSAPVIATFKSTHYVLRNGVNLSSFIESSAFAVQYWSVSLANYTAYSVLIPSYPSVSSIVTSSSPPASGVVLTSGTVSNGGSNPQGLLPGDSILTVIERVASIIDGQADSYTGNIGFTSVNWQLTTS